MKTWQAVIVAFGCLGLIFAGPTNIKAAHAATPDNVYGWNEIPQDQHIPISRALFDRGGYQLYDTSGDIIAIPFTGDSLSVLKFHRSHNGTMFLVNRGDAPVLYVPVDGYLENATVPGAYWYPFAHGYDPSQPVYMSVAPSYDDYDNMGWYPGMAAYGGYYSNDYVGEGAAFGLVVGLSFLIGGHNYDGWQPYHRYYSDHGSGYHMGYRNQAIYDWAGQHDANRTFPGGGQRQFNSGNLGQRQFNSGNLGQRQFNGGNLGQRQFNGGNPGQQHQFNGGNPGQQHQFNGGNPGQQHQFNGGNPGQQHQFNGGNSGQQRQFNGGNPGQRPFGGNTVRQQPFNSGSTGQHQSTGGGQHQFSGGGGNNSHGGDHSGGGRQNGNDHQH